VIAPDKQKFAGGINPVVSPCLQWLAFLQPRNYPPTMGENMGTLRQTAPGAGRRRAAA
jgi:hypothetical protein